MPLYLIRHGETAWSRSGRHTGVTDIPLTERGEDEARALAAALADIRFDRVFSSPRRRAMRTCELAGLADAAAIEPDLVEWDYGDYEGLRTAEIRARRPDWDLFRDGCPHGESPDGVAGRADRLITRIGGFADTVAIFSHGHFGRLLGARWIGLPVTDAPRFLLDTSSISILGFAHDSAAEPAIVLWNAGVNHTFSPAPAIAGRDEGTASDRRAIERWENEGGEIPVIGSATQGPPRP